MSEDRVYIFDPWPPESSSDGLSSDEGEALSPDALRQLYDQWRSENLFEFRDLATGERIREYYFAGGMQVSIRSPHSPRVAYYRRLPIGSPTRAAIEKYLFSAEEPLSTTEALEVYRYVRDFSGATVTGLSLRELNRAHLDTIVEACLDAGADPF